MKTLLLPSGEACSSPYPMVLLLILNMFMPLKRCSMGSFGSKTFLDVLDSMSHRYKQPSSQLAVARYSVPDTFTKVADQYTLLCDRMTAALYLFGHITDSDGFSKQLIPMASDSDIEKLFPVYAFFSIVLT